MLQHTQYGPRLLHHFHVLWNCIGGDLFWGRSPSVIWAEPCVLCRSEPSWTHRSSSLRLCWVVVSVGVSSYLASHTSAKICGGTRQWKWNTLMLRIVRWWNEKRLVDPGSWILWLSFCMRQIVLTFASCAGCPKRAHSHWWQGNYRWHAAPAAAACNPLKDHLIISRHFTVSIRLKWFP